MNWIDQITHNEAEQQFEITVDGDTAFAQYSKQKDDVIVYPHTVVPKSIDDQGIGTALATYAMNYARENGLKIKPRCPFIAHFMKENLEEYGDLLFAGYQLPD